MKVLIVSQYYWPENFLINSLVSLLIDRGITVTVLTGKPNYPDGEIFKGYQASGLQHEVHDSYPILRIPILKRGKKSKIGLALNYLSFILSGLIFGPRIVRDIDYDLVFVYAPSPLLQALPAIRLARKREAPLIVWVQDLWPQSLSATGNIKNSWVLALVEWLVRLIYRNCDRILVQSHAFIPPVESLTNKPGNIHYYPNLYHVSHTSQVSDRARALVAKIRMQFSVVFAGNLGTAQSLETIIEAARELLPHSDIRIVLVGSGSQDSWLAEQQRIYGLSNIILAGRFEAVDMPAIFSAAQALLVSLRPDPIFQLTIPSKVQAYLAAGRPILAALDGEGARIIQEAGAGLCSPAGDARALTKNIRHLHAMPPQERKHFGQRGRQYFEGNFEPEILADKLIDHFKESVLQKDKE